MSPTVTCQIGYNIMYNYYIMDTSFMILTMRVQVGTYPAGETSIFQHGTQTKKRAQRLASRAHARCLPRARPASPDSGATLAIPSHYRAAHATP